MRRSDPHALAGALALSISALVRRLRQVHAPGDLSLPERATLARLDRDGPASSAELARREQISPQSMGATIADLEARGLVTRQPDPSDGRRILLSVSPAGAQVLRARRAARAEVLADALSSGFSTEELAKLAAAAPLLERLAQLL